MEKAETGHFVAASTDQGAGLRIADLLGKAVYVSLLALIAFTAIPYGTAEPWWKAFFICAVFALCILAIIHRLSHHSTSIRGRALLIPLLVITAFSLLQTAPLRPQALPGISHLSWGAISADPFATRFVAFQLLALTLAAALLYRYASNERRMRVLIHVIIAVVVASAIFGLLRQTSQREVGFLIPLIKPEEGYGQFINRNHFAFLMEMGFGLALGMIVGGGVKRERALIYFAALLPIWTALVLSNSRGGLLAMLAQLIAAALLVTFAVPASSSASVRLRVLSVARLLPVRIALLVVLLGAVGVGTVWVGGDRLVDRIEEAPVENHPSGGSRTEIWRATWQMIKAHPIAGVGMGGYWIAIHEYQDASGVLAPQEAHNEYLELLASGGIIGAAIGVWFCIALIKRTRANFRSPDRFRRAACFGASLGIVGVACHSLFDFGLHKLVNALIFIALVMIATNSENAEYGSRSNDA